MTDKEQIKIDGVDVSECISFNKCNGKNLCCYDDTREDKIPFANFCVENKDCYFKQLARKTQECEELKEENQKLEMQLCNDCGEKDDYNIPCKMIRDLDYGLQKEIEVNDRYCKALEDIKEYTRKQFCDNCEDIGSTEYTCHCEYCEYQEYFKIIKKAKDGKNDNSININ